MRATTSAFSAPIHLCRPSTGLNRAQWRTLQRQWQRDFSCKHQRPTSRTFQLRTARRYQSTEGTAAPSPKPSPAPSAAPAPAPAPSAAPSPAPKAAAAGSSLRNWIYGTATVLFLGFGFLYITDTRASIHQFVVVPSLRLLHVDAEEAHHAAIKYVKGLYAFGLHPRERDTADQTMGDLKVEVFGHILNNPVGTSAGIDKNADIPDPLFELGAAVVEVGGVTSKPQEGNPKPRVFRIPSQNALINRYGLNSEGAEHVAMVLRERVRQYAYDHGLGLDAEAERLVLDGEAGVPPGSLRDGKVLAVQVAKNKVTPDSDIAAVAKDYVTCVDHLAKYADVLVVNVSSPNTPGLRDLQATAPLTAILSSVVDSAKSISRKTKPAVMVKVSPDEDSDAQVEGICSAVWSSGVDGVIVGNTTKKRPDPVPQGYVMPANEEKLLSEVGGYSGPQMFERTLSLVKKYRSKLDLGPVEDEGAKSASSLASDKEPVSASEPVQTASSTSDLTANTIEASVQRDAQHLKPLTTEADKESQQPIVKVPERHHTSELQSSGQTLEPASVSGPVSAVAPPPSNPASPTTSQSTQATSSTSSPASTSPSKSGSKTKDLEPKVIFATGGITNGEQCLQILNAGASVCQVYTAMMYGGVGTVTRIKQEMREKMHQHGKDGKQ
ncbi:FMN-linked oxidoreductase [Hortaea werneckii]|nr:FMN-linked oxidoreductase [Hortaea werneckii]